MADLPADQVTYLHGDLDLHIISARHLPNMDMVSERIRRCLTMCRTPSSGDGDEGPRNREYDSGNEDDGDREARRSAKIVTSDPYVTVKVPQATVARTRVVKNSQNPTWNQKFKIQLAHPVIYLEIQVKDDDVFGAEVIGVAKIPAEEIASGREISGWFQLEGPSGKPPKPHTAIQLKMIFTKVDENPLYQHGVAGDPDHLGVRHSYFPLRKGSHVTLYQDAHATDELPGIMLDGNCTYRPGKCWEDICYAISEAHHLIYIVGWSVFHKIKLVREPTRPLPRGGKLTLGELLKYKSEEGVRVLLLVWDDKTSHDKYFIHTQGVMETHDEETRKFFKHSSVNCVLVPRYASSKLSYIKQQVVGTMFTHHQKCVLVDTQASGNNRKVTAFIGGIDLCDGRYDTPEHRLFRDLDTVFAGDFHNPTFPAGTKAPRQPWHDLHCKIEGPAAYDVLVNFEQRWKRATRFKEFSLLFKGKTHWRDDSLIKIERISWILSPKTPDPSNPQDLISSLIKRHRRDNPEDHITHIPEDNPELYIFSEEDPNNWHVQIFRSIDSGSLKGFPTKNEAIAEKQNLIVAKNLVIERSIQNAYVQAIRSAQHFIYIENQYFLGSSYAWPSYKNAGADNLIPMELALKIASKIRANERFAVYIVIPMWPEGDPETATVQEILFWQSQTMQMMYGIVAGALKDMQLVDAHPQDYLNFYCLGKREEPPKDDTSEASQSSAHNSPVSASYKFGRFMIYVHAKGMIVDDEYVIMGSANINQRSLAGTKDTEIAMGAYQPHHTWAEQKRHPCGQVYGYRMSLWAEHLGMKEVEECYKDPSSLRCVKEVNEIAVGNWEKFSAESMVMLQGHLLKYPIQVDANGKVGPLEGSTKFPDVGGKVLGAYSATLPDILTT